MENGEEVLWFLNSIPTECMAHLLNTSHTHAYQSESLTIGMPYVHEFVYLAYYPARLVSLNV